MSESRSKIGLLGAIKRWGEKRMPTRTVRASQEASEALKLIPIAERSKVATDGILWAVAAYQAQEGS